MAERLKPWTTSALRLTQDIDGATKRLNQLLASVTTVPEDLPSQKLVTFAHNAVAQSQDVFPQLNGSLDTLHAYIEAAPPQ